MSDVRLALCLPQTDMVTADYACSLAGLKMHLAMYPPAERVTTVVRRSSIIHFSRASIAQAAIQEDATHLLWIDSDHTFPPDTAHQLLRHKRDIIGINAVTRRGETRFTATRDEKFVPTREDSEGIEEVHCIGFGICLIKAEVFLKVDQPWFDFEWIHKNDKEITIRGEDVYFCEKARAMGYRIYIDHELSRNTGHVGQVSWEWSDVKTD